MKIALPIAPRLSAGAARLRRAAPPEDAGDWAPEPAWAELRAGRAPVSASHRSRTEPVVIAFDQPSLRTSLVMVLLLVVAARLAMWAFGRVDNLLLTLLLAWLFAIAMDPPIRVLQRHGIRRRSLAVGLVMFAGLGILASFIAIFGGALFSQLAGLATSLPGLVQEWIRWINETFDLDFDPTGLSTDLQANATQIATIASNLAGGVVGVLTTIAGAIFQIAAIVLFAYYLAADGPRLRRLIGSWLPHDSQRVFVTVWDTTVSKTGGFVVSKLLLSVISAFAHGALFAGLDVPFWIPWALWVGFTSQFIPTVGTYIGVALPVLATVFTSPWNAAIIVIYATVYQQLENYILIPRISRRTMDIHPAVAFGSVLFGFALFGWVGGLVAIPLTAAILSVISAYGRPYELIPELAEPAPAGPVLFGPDRDPLEREADSGGGQAPGAHAAAPPPTSTNNRVTGAVDA
ncbi:MAG: AI-2E family transporter [Candidatus Nanopelagicales bacterium]